MRGYRTLAVAVAAVAVAGCGGDDRDAGRPSTATTLIEQRLSASDRDLIQSSQRAIQSYCRKRTLGLSEPSRAPTVQQQARALEAVDELIELGGAKPSARVTAGVDVRLFLGDLTENLEGSNCDPAIVQRLDQGLATLTSPG